MAGLFAISFHWPGFHVVFLLLILLQCLCTTYSAYTITNSSAQVLAGANFFFWFVPGEQYWRRQSLMHACDVF